MVAIEGDVSGRVAGACHRIDRFIESGHTVRALVELRALLDEGGYWIDPDRESPARTVYLKSVDQFAARGVSESELNITLHA